MNEPATSDGAAPSPAASAPAPTKTFRARVLSAFAGRTVGEWGDFTNAELKAGIAAGALDPKADEGAFRAAQEDASAGKK